MAYESPLKIFRDEYKNPDLYENGQVKVRPIKRPLDGGGFEENEPSPEKLEVFGSVYKQTVDLIKSVEVTSNLQDYPEEMIIVEKRRETVLVYMNRILEDIKNYLTQVNTLQLQRLADYDDHRKYQYAVKSADELRRSYHNIMIQDIKMAIRLININFNADYPKEARLTEEARMLDRKGVPSEKLEDLMNKRNYLKFPYPSGVFIDFSRMPKDQQGERGYIADWALKMYTDLSVLKSDLEEKK
jgi:hypothetical protein